MLEAVMSMHAYMLGVFFVFGSLVGSFLNVCIYRVPLAVSIVAPRSRCNRCGVPIAWYDNLPIISFFILAGRCRFCGVYIGVRHFWIELFVGLASAFLFSQYGVSFEFLYFFVFFSVLIVVTFIDIDHQIIPDGISYWGMATGVLLALHFEIAQMRWDVDFAQSILGLLFGGGLLWFVAWAYEKVTLREGLGFGDVKLMGFFGAHVGIEGVCFVLFYGAFLGSIVGVAMMIFGQAHKRTAIPFGPYLCLGLVLYELRIHELFGFWSVV
ncbi:MAG: prepilin peptidase [Bdellovibrionales bacterium]|nr:prepilin peptidase [Bdellovibrionales bacterium]